MGLTTSSGMSAFPHSSAVGPEALFGIPYPEILKLKRRFDELGVTTVEEYEQKLISDTVEQWEKMNDARK